MISPSLRALSSIGMPFVLVVDDNHTICVALAKLLKMTSAVEACCVTSGEEALTFISQHATDLVVLDIMMPGISGLEVLQRLREEPATPRSPCGHVLGLR
jgi:CheY-like chemotaxis protein